MGAAAVCAALAVVQPANANIVLDGGQAASTSKGIGNDVIGPVYGQASINGFYFGDLSPKVGPKVFMQGTLKVDVKSTIDFSYLGSEAGYKNQFQVFTGGIWTPLKSTRGASEPNAEIAGSGIKKIVDFAAGSVVPEAIGLTYTLDADEVIPFRFVINGGNGPSTKYAPNDGKTRMEYCSFCSILVTFLDDQNKPLNEAGQAGRSGSVVDVFVNDGNIDDNHDDMAIRIRATPMVMPVPVPAALPIALAAFAGFGFAGWRNRRATA